MKKPDKRDIVIQAALELIAEKGFHGAPMSMIAEKSGVAVGTIYRTSKQGCANKRVVP
jgi:AcrR family transcriptional regulator